jgi:hypothetical protein
MAKKKETEQSTITLIQWLIENTDSKNYRAGKATGFSHPAVDGKLLQRLGGRANLLEQARKMEKNDALCAAGRIKFDWRDMNGDIKAIHYAVDIMPELCRREGIEDPRERQLRYIDRLSVWKSRAEGTWLAAYYEEEIRKLEEGNCSQTIQSDLKEEHLFRCLDAILHLDEPLEKRIFSARVFQNVTIPEKNHRRGKLLPSKIFEQLYEGRVVGILKRSPEYEEEMSSDELLQAHGILSYAQTLEWKGALTYQLDTGELIDTSGNRYGTMINAQTLEYGSPIGLPGVRKIFVIENKANYEKKSFQKDELYIFCHGFFSPKEVRFLKKITEVAERGTGYYHWGDMDYGGIRIFCFNQRRVFPELKPYRMDRQTYEAALAAGAGVPIEDEKRKKYECLNAGELEDLKNCILAYGLEIEQELLAEY